MVALWTPDQPLPDLPSMLSWVTDHIAISSYEQACAEDLLKSEGVEAIISIGELAPRTTLQHIHFANVPDREHLDVVTVLRIVTTIRSWAQRKNVLVHCAAGVSRSPAFVAGALCWHGDWDAAKALVLKGRPIAKMDPVTEASVRAAVERR